MAAWDATIGAIELHFNTTPMTRAGVKKGTDPVSRLAASDNGR